MVSVFMMTYNHEKYITQALEGILMQKTNFVFDIVIGEDCSTDNTRRIVMNFAEKYPDKFNCLLHNKNIGVVANQLATLKECSGKYIAICEGDDYWTDPYKLQKQVDILESNPDFVLIHTNKAVLHNDKLHVSSSIQIKSGFVFEELMFAPLICTLTVLVRSDIMKASIPRVCKLMEKRKWLMGDFPLWLDIAKNFQIAYLNDVTGVYRFLDESASHSKSKVKAYQFEHSVIDVKEYYFKIYTKSNNKSSFKFMLRFSEMMFHARKKLVLKYGWNAKREFIGIIFTNPFLHLFFLLNKIQRTLKVK
jgi:glycosyltransferase involved in cell wall biosynthesis